MKSSRNVLVACAARKLEHRAPAASLYSSGLFRMSMLYARRLQADRIFILSAKYGLLAPDDIIEPYDLPLNTMTAAQRLEWADGVMESLRQRADPDRDEFILLAGAKYRENLAPHLASVLVPMQGLGIGRQLQFLSRSLA